MRILLVLFLSSSSAFGVGFSRGNHFTYRSIQGDVEIQCPNIQINSYCRDTFLDPWPYDAFIGPRFRDAVKVVLESANGIQESVYDGNRGRSEEVNLGVSNLFQRPLLKLGTNQIQYKIIGRQRNLLIEGQFMVEVTRAVGSTCLPKKMLFRSEEECGQTYSVCQQYFREMKYCRQN